MSGWAQRDAEEREDEAEAVEAVYKELNELRERCEWRPIESAPKDGTRVLLYRDLWMESMGVCFWDGVQCEWRPVNGSCFPGSSHWMPLPEPPADQERV